MTDQFDDIGYWASGTLPPEGELVLTPGEIEAIVDGAFSTLGTLVTDAGEIPATATARPRGSFTLPDDMRLYLESGSLISYDDMGAPILSPLVYILKQVPEGSGGLTIYEVWIDDNS